MILVFSSNELDFLILQNGKDGVSADSKYTWVKYSQNSDGSNLTDDPTDAIYIGFAYNMESPEESENPDDYLWTKIKGDAGENGSDAYTIILGNENISFSVGYDSNAALSNQSYSSTVQILQGVEERADFTIGEISSANGISVTKNDQDKTIVLSVKQGDTITADSGYFRIPINIDGLIFYKDLTWNLARQGQPGEQGEPGQAGEGAINVVVANESQTIACTNDGLVSESVLINIPFTAFKGFDKVPCSAVVGILPSGITLGSNTSATSDEDGLIVLNVAAKSNLGGTNILSGYVNLTFSVENQTILKRFIWTKTKDGKDGNTYSLELSSVIVNKNYDGTISPQSITLNAYYQNGNERAPYEGRFIIAQSVRDDMYLIDENNNLLVDENNNLLFVSGSGNSIFENVYVSSKNESTYTYTLPDSISGLVCYLCKSDSITNILDQQTVTVLNYIDDIKPIITEITTTMSGVSQKVDAVEKSITDKVWQTDITTQINNYDNTTTKIIRDRVTQVEQDIDGITSSVSDIESSFNGDIQELTTKISQVEQDANGFKTTVEQSYAKKDDLENEATSIRSEISQTASEINQSIFDLEGNTSKISQDLSSLTTRVEGTEGDVTELKQTASGIQTSVGNIKEDIESFETKINQNSEKIELVSSSTEQISENLENNYYNKVDIDAKIKIESDRITQTVTETISDIEIGGRNLLLNSSFNDDINQWETKGDLVTSLVSYKGKSCIKIDGNIGIYDYLRQSVLDKLSPDTEYTASAWVLTENIVEGSTDPSLWWCYHSGEYGDNATPFSYGRADFPVNNQEWEHVTWTFMTDSDGKTESATESYIYVYVGDVAGQVYISNLKLEKGNKATDWTPAPEDQATADDIEDLQESMTGMGEQIAESESEIEQLANSISMMVTDANGQSLMEQTSEGWTFNIGAIQSQIDEAAAGLDTVEKNLNSTTDMVNKANNLLDDVTQKTAYINMATDDSGAPCIELGKQGNPFKLRITNTSIDFMQDNMRIAYITNRQLYIEKSVVTDEMKVGSTSGFIWKKRSNGNMGLRWVGE